MPHLRVAALTLIGSIFIGAAVFAGVPPPAAQSSTVTVRLLAFNDLHGTLDPPPRTSLPALPATETPPPLPLGGVAYLASLIQSQRRAVPLNAVVAAGDVIGASPLESSHFHDEPTITALNLLGLEYSAVGNHEFDRGRTELLRMQSGGCLPTRDDSSCVEGRFSGAHFKYLAANVIDRATGKTLFPAYAIKTFDVDGRTLKIGFIGAVLRQTPGMVAPAGIAGLQFVDEAEAVNAQIAVLKRAQVSVIVLLIHQGIETDGGYDDPDCPGARGELLSILSRLDPAVDIVVSGHTHQAYVCHAIEPDRSQPLLYTSAGSYGRYLTEIDLQLARDSGRLLTATAHNLLVVNDSAPRVDAGTYVPLAPQPEVAALVQRYDARVNVLKQRPLGRITAAFTRTPAPSGETALGDLVADAQWAATAAPEDGGADLALTNIGGLRTDVSVVSRALTYGDVYAAQPFNNTLVTVTLSGVDLKALLEAQWRDPAQPPRILQVSAGFHYTWSASALPGQHVDAASMRIRNVAVDPKRDYRVTINSFLAQGGDGFRLLRSASQRRESGLLDADVLADYIREHSPLTPSPAVRIERRD